MRLTERGTLLVENGQDFDHNEDRYPTLDYVFARVLDAIGDEVLAVERVEVAALASGECTYRVWPARAEEPEQGYFPPDSAS